MKLFYTSMFLTVACCISINFFYCSLASFVIVVQTEPTDWFQQCRMLYLEEKVWFDVLMSTGNVLCTPVLQLEESDTNLYTGERPRAAVSSPLKKEI